MNDRDSRIVELEERLSKPRGGVRPWLGLAGIAAAVWFIAGPLRPDLRYFFADRSPLPLSIEQGTAWSSLESNRYVEVRGVPTKRGAYFRQKGESFVVVGLQDSPLLVRRHTLPTEPWKDGQTPPAPDPRPFTTRGRLLARADAGRYHDGFEKLGAFGEVEPRFIILAGEAPGADATPLFVTGALVTLCLLQIVVWMRRARPRPPP